MTREQGQVVAFCHACRWTYVAASMIQADRALTLHRAQCPVLQGTGRGVTA